MNFPRLRRNFEIIWGITQKDLKIIFRFPKNAVASRLIEPLRLFILLGLVYQSFFVMTENQTIGNWSRSNYVPALLLGAIFYTGFNQAYTRFRVLFTLEKYWRTIQVFLTAPVSKLQFLIGSSLALFIELSIPIVVYFLILICAYHVSLLALIPVLVVLYLMIFGLLGFSLMQGAFAVSNENYLFAFDYLFAVWAVLSCFYYSEGALPSVVRRLVFINPVYHAVELARSAIFHHLSASQMLTGTIFVLLFSILSPFLGALFFRKIVRETGVRGF